MAKKRIPAEERKEYKGGKYMGGPAEERAEKKKKGKRMAAGGLPDVTTMGSNIAQKLRGYGDKLSSFMPQNHTMGAPGMPPAGGQMPRPDRQEMGDEQRGGRRFRGGDEGRTDGNRLERMNARYDRLKSKFPDYAWGNTEPTTIDGYRDALRNFRQSRGELGDRRRGLGMKGGPQISTPLPPANPVMRGGGLAKKGVGMALRGGGLAKKGVGQALAKGGLVKGAGCAQRGVKKARMK